ncbi:hemoglobin subunit beta-like [Trichomycterus rosablanca]|uniref:hemoglobin subunit beta-like n=1 Tax=Trichomycterus rosablanca TaxID=2290929 RepID=UPI002F355628
MVQWTDFERATIQGVFSKIDHSSVGHQALARCLVVYPWTQRYFSKFGNLYNAAAIVGNSKVAAHGLTVVRSLEKAVKNLDNIKAEYADLSVLHSEKLHVDPENFRLLADCISIVVAATMGASTSSWLSRH